MLNCAVMNILNKRKGKILVFSVSAGIVAVAGLLTATLLTGPRVGEAGVLSESFLQQTSELVAGNAITTDAKSIESTLGFKVTYDSSLIKARAQTTDPASTETNIFGVEYDETEIGEPRDYSIAKFTVRTPDDSKPLLIDEVQLSVSTNIREDYFTSREALPENAGKSKREILIDTISASNLRDTENVVAQPQVTKVISGIEYTYVRFERTYTSLGEVTATYYDDFYFTVQNDRPYWASIRNIKPVNADQVPLLEAVIASVTYDTEDAEPAVIETSANVINLPKGTSYTPEPVDTVSLLPVVLKNQPAVVRIAASYCFDGSLRTSSGQTVGSFTAACAAGVGSGSIISSDGYIATNGHVVRFTPAEALQSAIDLAYGFDRTETINSVAATVIEYYVAEGQITRSAADSFIQQVESGSLEAIATAIDLSYAIPPSAIIASEERYHYAIQTSNEPFRLADTTTGDAVFTYTNTILEASYIDSNFTNDGSAGLSPNTVGSDVALLKMEGSFPIITLGSIDSINESTLMTALGYPAFVDGALGTEQETTVPSVTQGGLVEKLYTPADAEHLLIRTTIPISGGNSGGPSFDEDGLQVGLNTYGSIECPDQNCFGNGIARDVQDLKELIEKNSISLNTNSTITNTWNEGLEALQNGDGNAAKRAFESVAASYPANYLADDLAVLSESVSGGTPFFGTTANSNGLNVQTIFLVIAGLIVLLVIIPGSILLITFVRKQKEPALVGAVTTPVQPTVISGTQNSEQSQQQTPVQPPQNPTIQTPPSTPAAFDPFKPASEPQRSTPPQSNTQPTPSAPVPAPQPPEQPQPPQDQPPQQQP